MLFRFLLNVIFLSHLLLLSGFTYTSTNIFQKNLIQDENNWNEFFKTYGMHYTPSSLVQDTTTTNIQSNNQSLKEEGSSEKVDQSADTASSYIRETYPLFFNREDKLATKGILIRIIERSILQTHNFSTEVAKRYLQSFKILVLILLPDKYNRSKAAKFFRHYYICDNSNKHSFVMHISMLPHCFKIIDALLPQFNERFYYALNFMNRMFLTKKMLAFQKQASFSKKLTELASKHGLTQKCRELIKDQSKLSADEEDIIKVFLKKVT